jgi:hypothetical protein
MLFFLHSLAALKKSSEIASVSSVPSFPSIHWNLYCHSELVLLDFGTPWWQNDAKYCIGTLSKKTRRIQIVNVLTEQQDVLEVCSEETVNEILNRYLELNRYFCGKQPQFLMRKVHILHFVFSFMPL